MRTKSEKSIRACTVKVTLVTFLFLLEKHEQWGNWLRASWLNSQELALRWQDNQQIKPFHYTQLLFCLAQYQSHCCMVLSAVPGYRSSRQNHFVVTNRTTPSYFRLTAPSPLSSWAVDHPQDRAALPLFTLTAPHCKSVAPHTASSTGTLISDRHLLWRHLL